MKGVIHLQSATWQLGRVAALKASIEKKQNRLIELKVMSTCSGGMRYDKDPVQTSKSGDTLEKAVINYVELEEEIERQKIELYEQIAECKRLIDLLPDEREQKVIRMKYLENAGCFDICDAIGKSRFTVWRIEQDALKYLDKIIEEV